MLRLASGKRKLPSGRTRAHPYDGRLGVGQAFSGTLNKSIAIGYNAEFQVDSVFYAGTTDAIAYDDDGLVIGVGDFTVDRVAANGTVEFVTDDNLRLTPHVTQYGEVDGLEYEVDSSLVADFGLAINDLGQITAKVEVVDGDTDTYVYGYDDVGRLTSVTKNSLLVEQYTYDANGNRLTELNTLRGISPVRSYSYDADDRLRFAGSVAYGFDDDGFLTTKIDGSDVTTYDYSSDGELLGVVLPDLTEIEYIHSPGGQRIAKVVDGVITEKYLWSGMTTLLAVFDGSGVLKARFLYADGRLPVAMDVGAARYYLASDQVGSLRAVIDSTGEVVKEIDYDSFGNILADSNPTFEVPFGFAGGLHDRDTGLVRFGHRDYDPEVGRWTAKDPLRMLDGPNRYGYVRSNPISFIDPLGLTQEGAEVGYGETSGLRPHQRPRPSGVSSWSINNPATWDLWSWLELQAARRDMADVSERNSLVQREDKSQSTNPIERKIWSDCELAAKAAESYDLPPGTRHYFIRQEGVGRQKPEGWEEKGGRVLRSYGPFHNYGGGDVPAGPNTYIDIWIGVP